MASWFCTTGGQKYGPVDDAAMRQWIVEGRVKADTLVWNEGMPDWVAAASVPELAPCFQSVIPPVPSVAFAPAGTINAPGSVAAMVCGIIGVTTGWCFGVPGVVLGIVALTMARKARTACSLSPGKYSGQGMATAGYVLGIISTILGVLWMIYYIVAISVGIHSATSYRRF